MDKKVIFLSRSDLRGGAAIVTYRLMMAMREQGIDARMLVCEKLSDSPYVDYCAPKWRIQYSFLKERLEVFIKNGLNRSTLFKVDPATEGLPVWNHPWVKEADGIFLGWVNQGMLSLRGIDALAKSQEPRTKNQGSRVKSQGSRVKGQVPLVWVMHDMWSMTGICHHAGDCGRYMAECGDCPFLGKKKAADDMSHSTWLRKKELYDSVSIKFVAVSSWLASKAKESSLLQNKEVTVIPNPFPGVGRHGPCVRDHDRIDRNPYPTIRIIFGAARLDDPIKGLPVLKEALRILRDDHPKEAGAMELVTFGTFKNSESGEGFAIPHRHLGVLSGEEAIRNAYEECDIVVSSSDFETLPGTLIEGQAYGCIPVAFDHGGQRDIIDHEETGWLAPWDDDASKRAYRLAEGILWACHKVGDATMLERMRTSVVEKFGSESVAKRMISLIE